ncbi:MAG: alpha-amylase family glycosyl hydrolase [Limnobacter sp.]|uniref:alpha-amylase family glycosyl hydrolase n=1 Tax=Limnobacter sp. TaxID=2003368 RepID=UPI00391CEE07
MTSQHPSFTAPQGTHADLAAFLLQRLAMIYKDTEVAAHTARRLEQVIANRHEQRSTALKALDAKRLNNPQWFTGNHFMAYSTYVDKFGGTFKGVQQRIAHLQSLGVNYVHLLPFLKMRPGQNDGGFAVEHFTEMEPRLGTTEDFQALSVALREAGISLCADLVLNHVADTHDWALRARSGDPSCVAMFHWRSAEAKDALEPLLPQIFPQTAPGNFVWVEEQGRYVWSTFYTYQWDLNYSNPDVLVGMIDNMLALANMGVEVFRLDSAAFLWKKEGTNCMNQPECHWILQCFRAAAQWCAPGVLLKAEAIVPTRELPPYFGLDDAAGKECHLAYQSSLMAAAWYSLANSDASLVQRILGELPAMTDTTTWISYIRCHDDIGWNVLKPELTGNEPEQLKYASAFFSGQVPESFAKGISFQATHPDAVHGTNGMTADLLGWAEHRQDELGWARYQLMTAFMFSLGGIPMVYMGDELAQHGQDIALQATWTDTRDIHRPPLDDSAMLAAGVPGSRAHSALNWIKTLRQLHMNWLTATNTSHLRLVDTHDPRLLSIQHGAVTCVFNFSGQAVPWPAALNGHRTAHDLLMPNETPAERAAVQPYQALYLVLA